MAGGRFPWYKLSGGVPFRLFTRSRNAGLSIAELLVASALLAMVLVTVMTLFGQLLRNTQKNALLSAGSFFADGVMEKFITEAQLRVEKHGTSTAGFDLPQFTRAGERYTLENGEGFLNIDQGDKPTRYLYRVEAEHLLGFAAAEQGQLWKVTTEVRWWQDSTTGASETRAGIGNLSVLRTRIVYLGDSE